MENNLALTASNGLKRRATPTAEDQNPLKRQAIDRDPLKEVGKSSDSRRQIFESAGKSHNSDPHKYEAAVASKERRRARLENLPAELMTKILWISKELSLIHVHPNLHKALPKFSHASMALQLFAFYSPFLQDGNGHSLVTGVEELDATISQPLSDTFLKKHDIPGAGFGSKRFADEERANLQHSVILSGWWNIRQFNLFMLRCQRACLLELCDRVQKSGKYFWARYRHPAELDLAKFYDDARSSQPLQEQYSRFAKEGVGRSLDSGIKDCPAVVISADPRTPYSDPPAYHPSICFCMDGSRILHHGSAHWPNYTAVSLCFYKLDMPAEAFLRPRSTVLEYGSFPHNVSVLGSGDRNYWYGLLDENGFTCGRWDSLASTDKAIEVLLNKGDEGSQRLARQFWQSRIQDRPDEAHRDLSDAMYHAAVRSGHPSFVKTFVEYDLSVMKHRVAPLPDFALLLEEVARLEPTQTVARLMLTHIGRLHRQYEIAARRKK